MEMGVLDWPNRLELVGHFTLLLSLPEFLILKLRSRTHPYICISGYVLMGTVFRSVPRVSVYCFLYDIRGFVIASQ